MEIPEEMIETLVPAVREQLESPLMSKTVWNA